MRTILLSISLLLVSSVSAVAGPVTGRVVDPDARPIPGARVLVLGNGAIAAEAITDARGTFAIAAPDRGRYEVRVALDGFSAPPVAIDAAATPIDLGTLTVALSAISESVVVSAAQVEIPISQAASSVTVIPGAQLEAAQIESVADALRMVPGLSLTATGGRGAVTGAFPRGGESNYTLVFVDGIQANAFGGGFDFAHLPVSNIDRIEIVRGPQSALYGSNAIGGVVRIITRQGGPAAVNGTVEAGSFGTTRLTASASGSHGGWEWGGSAERLATDGFNGDRTAAGETIVNDDYSRSTGSVAAGWRRGDGATIRGSVRFARDERGYPGPFGSNPAGFFSGIDPISRGTNDHWLTSIGGAVALGRQLRMRAHVAYAAMDGRFTSPFSVEPSDAGSRRLTGRVQLDLTAGRGVEVSAGAELQRERATSTFITGEASTPIPVTRRVGGYFGEARWNAAQRLFVTAGLRVDDIRRDRLEPDPTLFVPRATGAESVVSANPKIAAAWYARPNAGTYTKVRGAAGTGIRPPDAFEIAFTNNPDLAPERSRSVEVGVDQALFAGRSLLEATAFFNTFDDLIIAVGSFSQASRWVTDNIANARARGLELAGTARTRLGGGRPIDVQLRVAYTFLDTDVLAVDRASTAPPPFTVGDPLLRRPRHSLSADASLTAGRLTAYVRGGGRGRVLDVEPSSGTFGGLFYNGGYQVWHAGASWKLHQSLDVFGRVDNLFDRAYEDALGFPALGRGAMAGVRVAAGR